MRLSSIALLAALASAAVPAATASAQRRSTSELQPGDAVRVWIRDTPTRLGGTVVSNSAPMLVLRVEASGDERRVMWDGVTRVDQYLGVDRGASARHGAKVGAFVGLALGAALGIAVARDCDILFNSSSDCVPAAAIVTASGTLIGAAGGGVIGALVGVHRWVRVPVAGGR